VDTRDVVEPPGRRSRLVSSVAWFGIVGGALGTLSGAGLVLAAPTLTNVGVLIGSACTLYSSIGLRARHEWARVGFMFVLAVSGVAGIVGAMRFRMPPLTVLGPSGTPTLTPEQFDAMAGQLRPLMIGMAVVGAIVNALLIAYFSTQRVRSEFDNDD